METKESSTIVAPSVVASCPGGDFIVVGGGGGLSVFGCLVTLVQLEVLYI